MLLRRKKVKKEDDRAKAAVKTREKQRRKMIRTKYGQAPLRHARKGVYSCIYGAVVFALFVFDDPDLFCDQRRSRGIDRSGGAGYCGAVHSRSDTRRPRFKGAG